MTACLFCGKPGREVIAGEQYRCDPCETTWAPVPAAAPDRAEGLNWTDIPVLPAEYVPHVDHGTRSVPCP